MAKSKIWNPVLKQYIYFDAENADKLGGIEATNYALKTDVTTQISTTKNEIENKKADKVIDAVTGNFVGLDDTGNLVDSGKKPSDFADKIDFDNLKSKVGNELLPTEYTSVIDGLTKLKNLTTNTVIILPSSDLPITGQEGILYVEI